VDDVERRASRKHASGDPRRPSTATGSGRHRDAGSVRRVDQSKSPGAWDADVLRAALVRPAGPYARLDVVDSIGSTNAALLAAAAEGAPDGSVLVAERQESGRGRLGREWVTPPGTAIAVSVLLRPVGVPTDRFGWLPLLTGLAVHQAVQAAVPSRACLKWPNDVLVGAEQRKAAGILAEASSGPDGTAVVLGIGLNVLGSPDSLPPGATSLQAEGARDVDRHALLIALLTALAARESAWRAAAGDPDADRLRADYRAVCGSLGAEVRVELPGGMTVTGMAEDVDGDGQLLLLNADGHRRAIAAGDVVHLRPVDRDDRAPVNRA
jgi:BirA family transcriptional regulator, biotin operon repressor / biotin---[acetyl-CoA-carboxylase] ligase